jgi:hypothetical protein
MTTYEKTGTIAAGRAMATPTGPRGYLDTNLIIGLVQEDLGPIEMRALRELLRVRKAGGIMLFTSHVAAEELEKRSTPEARQSDIYLLLDDLPAVDEEFRMPAKLGTMKLGSGPPIVQNAALGELRRILPGAADARRVFQAARNGVDYFVTCDVKTLVKHAAVVYETVGIRVRLPSQVLAELATETS